MVPLHNVFYFYPEVGRWQRTPHDCHGRTCGCRSAESRALMRRLCPDLDIYSDEETASASTTDSEVNTEHALPSPPRPPADDSPGGSPQPSSSSLLLTAAACVCVTVPFCLSCGSSDDPSPSQPPPPAPRSVPCLECGSSLPPQGAALDLACHETVVTDATVLQVPTHPLGLPPRPLCFYPPEHPLRELDLSMPPPPSPPPRPTVGYTSACRVYRKVASQPGPLRDIRMRSVGKHLDKLGEQDMLELLIEASDLMEWVASTTSTD